MEWNFHEMKQRRLVQYLHQSPPPLLPPTQSFQSDNSTFNNKVSPSILLIIILAMVFSLSGLIHLLVRFILRRSHREQEDFFNVTALQGRLQQLFNLHDAGVDQSLIDTLPVIHYKSILGTVNNPFDCAVCLCEFEAEDKLRLLPNCSHAFHMECIDTWLLAHSTCPLCRASLLLDFSAINNSSSPPFVNAHESGNESSRETVTDGESVVRSNSNVGLSGETESIEKDEADSGEKVVAVKLGKLRSVDGFEGCSASDIIYVDSRRCYSMGSFEYVMDENSKLQVSIRRTALKKQSRKKSCLPLNPGQRPAMSECDCESRRGFSGFETTSSAIDGNGNSIWKKSKRESLSSISKIWVREKEEKLNCGVGSCSSRRAFSFRFSSQNGSCSSIENNSKAIGSDEENQSCHSLDSEAKTPSFARRSVVWIAGRQNKVVHSSSSSFTSNV